MTPRRRAILVLGLILILIAIIVVVIVMLTRSVARQAPIEPVVEAPVSDVDAETAPEETGQKFENPLLLPAPVSDGRTASRQMAELFAERYGSYSNQGDYQNLRDLLPVMTSRYRNETEAFLREAEAVPGQAFEGVTSVKVSSSVRSADEDSAVVAVSLQQERTSGGAAPTIGYRTLRMELMLVGTDWRVDEAVWEN